MPADWTPLGAEDWREAYGPRTHLNALLNSGLVAAMSIEVALGLRAGVIDSYAAGDDSLSEAEEIALGRLLEEYRTALRRVNAAQAKQRLAEPRK